MPEAIRILLVDDHPVVREGVATMLETGEGFELVGEAGDADEAVAAYRRHEPDVVLLDLEIPEGGGVAVVRRLREAGEDPRILVFTAFDDDERIVEAVQAGVQGYLLKGTPRDELFDAIRTIHDGGSLLEPSVTAKLMGHVSRGGDDDSDDGDALTPRETEVLEELARGRSNKAIADELFISERTVKFHVSSILQKLGADNRTEAVALGVKRGLVEIE